MIGLTGGIASGKSTVASILRGMGAYVADADAIARRVMELPSVRNQIIDTFGVGVATEKGIDRSALAKAAFATRTGTDMLNSITHPIILQELLHTTQAAKESGQYLAIFADAPLLIESGLAAYCSSIWLVIANTTTRIQRIIERDGATPELATQRIGLQFTDAMKLPYADVVIYNNGTYTELEAETRAAFYKHCTISE